MGPVTAEITIDAPREQVYPLVSDLALRSSFCDHFQEQFRLERIDSTGIGASARFRIDAPRFPIWMETVITELDAPYMVVEQGKGSRLDRMAIGTAWELVQSGGTMTDVSVSFMTDPTHPIDKLKDKAMLAGWYERQWKRALQRLREMAESGIGIERLQVAGASRP